MEVSFGYLLRGDKETAKESAVTYKLKEESA